MAGLLYRMALAAVTSPGALAAAKEASRDVHA